MHYMLLPIYDKEQESEIVAFASVDPDDYSWALALPWVLDAYGYPRIRNPYLHRVVVDPPTGMTVDHEDGNPLNARRDNLRECTHAQNMQNKPAKQSNSSSQYRGVSWDKQRKEWAAKHKLNGHTYNIGRFKTELEAAEAAAQFRAEHMPYAVEGR